MGIKRIIDVGLWTDELVETFTPEERYFWLFLLTNPFTKQLGIYQITIKQMSFYLGYDIDTCKKLLDRFQNDYHLIRYIGNELAIKNYLKFAIVKGGKPVEDCLNSDISNVKNRKLISWVFGELDACNISATVKKVIEDYKERSKEINDNDNDNDNDSIVHVSCTYRDKTQKHQYGTYKNVLLSDNELETLKKEFDDWEERIERVSEYCASKGKSYKNYLATIRSWSRKEKPKHEDTLPTYDTSKNPDIDISRLDEILKRRRNNGNQK